MNSVSEWYCRGSWIVCFTYNGNGVFFDYKGTFVVKNVKVVAK